MHVCAYEYSCLLLLMERPEEDAGFLWDLSLKTGSLTEPEALSFLAMPANH